MMKRRTRIFAIVFLSLFATVAAAQFFGIPRRVFAMIVSNDLEVEGNLDIQGVISDSTGAINIGDSIVSDQQSLAADNSASYTMANTQPGLQWRETDAPADEVRWINFLNGGQWRLTAYADNWVTNEAAIIFDRTGANVDALTIAGEDMFPETGTFTVTLDTGCTTTPSGTATYSKIGDHVILRLPTLGTCTSNSTAKTATTDLPVSIRPTLATQYAVCRVQDNGTMDFGLCLIQSTGTIFWRIDANASFSTASGTWSTPEVTISYLLN